MKLQLQFMPGAHVIYGSGATALSGQSMLVISKGHFKRWLWLWLEESLAVYI